MKKQNSRNPYLVWIDHRNAIVVHAGSEGAIEERTFLSNQEERKRFSGEGSDKAGLFGQSIDHQRQQQSREEHYFQKFLDGVVDELDHPDSILILGPGSARFALENTLQQIKSMQGVYIENRPAGKMPSHALRAALQEMSALS
jgi:hypothetical protein